MLEEETGCWTIREEMLAFGMKIAVVERQLRTRERRIAKSNQDDDGTRKKSAKGGILVIIITMIFVIIVEEFTKNVS